MHCSDVRTVNSNIETQTFLNLDTVNIKYPCIIDYARPRECFNRFKREDELYIYILFTSRKDSLRFNQCK